MEQTNKTPNMFCCINLVTLLLSVASWVTAASAVSAPETHHQADTFPWTLTAPAGNFTGLYLVIPSHKAYATPRSFLTASLFIAGWPLDHVIWVYSGAASPAVKRNSHGGLNVHMPQRLFEYSAFVAPALIGAHASSSVQSMRSNRILAMQQGGAHAAPHGRSRALGDIAGVDHGTDDGGGGRASLISTARTVTQQDGDAPAAAGSNSHQLQPGLYDSTASPLFLLLHDTSLVHYNFTRKALAAFERVRSERCDVLWLSPWGQANIAVFTAAASAQIAAAFRAAGVQSLTKEEAVGMEMAGSAGLNHNLSIKHMARLAQCRVGPEDNAYARGPGGKVRLYSEVERIHMYFPAIDVSKFYVDNVNGPTKKHPNKP